MNIYIDSYQTTDCIYSWSTRNGGSYGVEYGNRNYLDLPAFALGSVRTFTKTNEYSIGKFTPMYYYFGRPNIPLDMVSMRFDMMEIPHDYKSTLNKAVVIRQF